MIDGKTHYMSKKSHKLEFYHKEIPRKAAHISDKDNQAQKGKWGGFKYRQG